MTSKTITEETLNYRAIGEQIPHELAIKMVKDFQDQHKDIKIISHVIGRDIIEKVLAQPGCVGIRFFEAINENGANTLVSVGIDNSGKDLIEIASVNEHGKIVITEGMISDRSRGDGEGWFSL